MVGLKGEDIGDKLKSNDKGDAGCGVENSSGEN